jgi:myosin-3
LSLSWEECRLQIKCNLHLFRKVCAVVSIFIISVARLLGVDEKKFLWALTNYCTIQEGTVVRRRHTQVEAEEARDILASGIYFRLVDWITSVVNHKLFFTRAVL